MNTNKLRKKACIKQQMMIFNFLINYLFDTLFLIVICLQFFYDLSTKKSTITHLYFVGIWKRKH